MGRHGVRCEWNEMPDHVRTAIDGITGAPVVDARNIAGGFSPGPAARCVLADGQVVFVKAAGLDLNPASPAMHRREGEILRTLEADVPAPSLLGVFDDGDWVALVIEWVHGVMPTAPLGAPDVGRLLGLVERLSAMRGDAALLQPCADEHPSLFGHWQALVEQPVDSLDTWSQRHLEPLAELEAEVATAIAGEHLVHLDLRTDNVLLSDDGPGGDVIVDWPGASLGAPWVDLVGLLPALELDGGPPPQDIFDQHPVGRASEADAVDAFIATIAGYFTRMSLLAPPPGLPTLRPFQADQARIARRWIAQRRGWEPAEQSR